MTFDWFWNHAQGIVWALMLGVMASALWLAIAS